MWTSFKLTLPEAIDDFVSEFQKVYGKYDKKRSEEQQWLLVVEESSRIAEAVREIEYGLILEHITDLFVWLCGFIGKCSDSNRNCYLEDDFSTIIWLKFPRKCPRCDTNPCYCLSLLKKLMKREKKQKEEAYQEIEKGARAQIDARPRRLDDIVAMFNEIFYSNILIMDIKEIAFHLLEEVGEVSEQIRELNADDKTDVKNHRIELRRELADVSSWLMALLIKVNILGKTSHKLTKALVELQENKTVEIPEIKVENSLLRTLIIKSYSDDNKLICKTCKQPECNLSLHTKKYPISTTKE